MQMQLKLARLTLALAAGLALSGCGNKGALYIPESPPQAKYTPTAENQQLPQQDSTAR